VNKFIKIFLSNQLHQCWI